MAFLSAMVSFGTGRTEELVTDRPDQTESSVVVPRGFIQIESGWIYTENDDVAGDVIQTHQLPSSLLRVGVLDNVELRLGMDGWNWKRGGVREKDFGDIEVGTKIHLVDEKSWRPETALLASLSIPTDGEGLDPAFRATFSHTLSDRLSTGTNLGVSWSTEEDPNQADFNYTTVLGVSLLSGVSMFVEFFGDVPIESSTSRSAAHSFDGGFTVLA
ncbi:transporter, partial [candidate division TA06 bacterium]|nr:transporter [candidate division TA06 bacterium]